MIYGAKDLAEAFRTVRKNTIQIAEDVPDEKYSFRATPDVQSIGEELAHIAASSTWAQQFAADRKTFLTFEDFGAYRARAEQLEKSLTSKAAIVDALRKHGDSFASFLEGLSEAQLAERVGFPPPVQPSSKTRFEILLAVKEHEMHHRGKLMLMQRLIGQVPHLTKRREEMRAAVAAAPRA